MMIMDRVTVASCDSAFPRSRVESEISGFFGSVRPGVAHCVDLIISRILEADSSALIGQLSPVAGKNDSARLSRREQDASQNFGFVVFVDDAPTRQIDSRGRGVTDDDNFLTQIISDWIDKGPLDVDFGIRHGTRLAGIRID